MSDLHYGMSQSAWHLYAVTVAQRDFAAEVLAADMAACDELPWEPPMSPEEEELAYLAAQGAQGELF